MLDSLLAISRALWDSEVLFQSWKSFTLSAGDKRGTELINDVIKANKIARDYFHSMTNGHES